ncbi:hypothetical protein NDU88_009863 [Pleurodeles waltl]|uniref:Uncharacterized protein n=1 Tax=Pleurodeles waltl TaxID=8319 RepID=A0AAV7QYQ7_PLEWA|nr:hypothetical protein NDU88_009863 [Pleurodeles waltl]
MGKADKRQAKLSFSGGEKRGATSEPRPGDADTEEGPSEMSVRAMFMELKTSLAGIDAKLDHVTERLDRIRARVDDHDARFETLETRTSDIEDARSGDREQIAQMERLMEVIRNKNEDLEARSRRNNIRIVGLPETTDMSRMEDFVENMLQELFPGELSRMLLMWPLDIYSIRIKGRGDLGEIGILSELEFHHDQGCEKVSAQRQFNLRSI